MGERAEGRLLRGLGRIWRWTGRSFLWFLDGRECTIEELAHR